MSMIEEVGGNLQRSVYNLREALTDIIDSQDELARGQSLLAGLAEGSTNPVLQETITSYAHAIKVVGELAGQIVQIGEGVYNIADRMGYQVDTMPPAPPPPLIKILGILEPTPVEGDRGNTTPEQFRAYEEKEKSVNRLIESGVDPATIEGHVAEGGTCQVYQTADGKIIKLPVVKMEDENQDEENEPVPPPAGTAWHGYAEALKRAQGEPGLEQYVAYIDDHGIAGRGAVVCEQAPGVTTNKLLFYELNNAPAEQIDGLMRSFQALERHGLQIDSELQNFMYDEKRGFTIIDYTTVKWFLRERPPTDRIGKADWMAKSFLRSVHRGADEHDVGARMQELRDFTNNYVAAYEKAFGAEAAERLREMIL